MLGWAITLFVISLIAAAFGFTGIAGAAAGLAKVLFVLFLIGAIVVFFIGYKATKAVLH